MSVVAYFPYMFYDNNKLYSTTQSPYSVSFDKDNTTSNVTYAEAASDIVAYMEGESVNAATGENSVYSNGKVGYVAGGKTQTIATLSAGKYTATINLAGNPNRAIVIRNIANSDVSTNTIISLPINKNSSAGLYTSDEFELTELTTIGFSGYTSGTKTNQSADIDYIFIKRTGDPSIVSAPITEAGYATFYSPYALSFSSVEGLTAYTASVTGDNVTFTQVAKVPANTGVLLKGSAGKYQIPVVTDGGDATSELVGGTATAPAGSFVLMNENDKVGFYKTKAEFTLGANTAYIPAQGGSTRDFIAIESEATAIKAIETKQQNGEIYNLAGQRVVKAQKGLYIQNGKKVIIK